MLPKCTKPSTNTPKPNRAMRLTETALPSRPKLRSNSELPQCTKSSTDVNNIEPNREIPKTKRKLPAD